MAKRSRSIEVCEFCGANYHPMPRWTKGDDMIFVCQPELKQFSPKPDIDCEQIANSRGFVKRLDLTPKR